jgi:hypothetical protein
MTQSKQHDDALLGIELRSELITRACTGNTTLFESLGAASVSIDAARAVMRAACHALEERGQEPETVTVLKAAEMVLGAAAGPFDAWMPDDVAEALARGRRRAAPMAKGVE